MTSIRKIRAFLFPLGAASCSAAVLHKGWQFDMCSPKPTFNHSAANDYIEPILWKNNVLQVQKDGF